MSVFKKLFRSRKWVVAIGAALLNIFSSRIGLDAETTQATTMCLLAGVGAEGLADAMGALRKDR